MESSPYCLKIQSIIKLAVISLLWLNGAIKIVNCNKDISVTFKNESPEDIEVGWFNPTTNEMADSKWKIDGNGGVMPLNSFQGHKFGFLVNENLIGTVIVKDHEVQQFVVGKDLKIRSSDANANRKMEHVSPWKGVGMSGSVKLLLFNDDKDEVMLSILTENNVDEREGAIGPGEHLFLDVSIDHSLSIKSKVKEEVVRVGESAQQAVLITNKSGVMTAKRVDVLSYSSKLSKEEYSMIKKAELREILRQCQQPGVDPSDCIRQLSASYLLEHSKQLQKLNTMKGFIADSWENYTCADSNLPTSAALENQTFHYHNNTYEVQVLHKRPSSQVHLLNNFITEEECDAIEKEAKNDLHAAATEGDEAGKASKVRKAMQAGVNVPYSDNRNPITTLAKKVIAYANHATNFTLEPDGQEPLMSIQYKGNGPNDPFPDQYLPHCDGSCDGTPFQLKGRVATMILYCKTPELGGATNFKNAGVHIVPKEASAIFFSYINPDDHTMDSGLTTHSGCPVIQGRKILVTQWLRKGVDKQNTYSQYSADGSKYADRRPPSNVCDNPFYSDFVDDLLPISSKDTCRKQDGSLSDLRLPPVQ